MGDDPKRVLVVETHEPLAEVLEAALQDDGYHTETIVNPERAVARARSAEPDVIALDLNVTRHGVEGVLDDLRSDRIVGHVPVVAMSTSAPMVEAARASYSVKETLVKPFDLDEFLTSVRRAVERPSMHEVLGAGDAPAGIRADAERIIAGGSRLALLRFADRLRQDPHWNRPDLPLASLLDGVPSMVEALDAALHLEDAGAAITGSSAVRDELHAHADERRDQHVALGSLMREYSLLRDELWNLLRENLGDDLDGREILDLERSLNGALDRMLEISVPRFVAPESEVGGDEVAA